jgi:hypothetical protein
MKHAKMPSNQPRYRCDRCGEIWDRSDLWYSEGDCPDEDCDGIDENMHIVEDDQQEPDQGREGFVTYFNVHLRRLVIVDVHESLTAWERNL